MKQVTIRRCMLCSIIRGHTDAVGTELRKNPKLQVHVVDGAKGEFTVQVDGHVVSQLTGDVLPTVKEVVTAVNADQG